MSTGTGTIMFVDDKAKARMTEWYGTFRAAIGYETESRFIETKEGKTHVLIAGPKDAPPMVVLHGALASAAHLLPEMGDLVKRHRIYAIDVMGQSVMSADQRIDVRDDSYGHWLAAVIKELGLEQVVLFGVSWGGFVALKTARVAPELIRALVLYVPAGVVSGSFWTGLTKLGWPMLMHRLSPSPKSLAKIMSVLFSGADENWTKYFGDALVSYKMDMRIPPLFKPEDLAMYRGPVRVVAADDDVSFPGAKLLARAKELFPDAEVDLIENCKHSPPMDEAFRARMADRVTAFLDRDQRDQGSPHESVPKDVSVQASA